MIDDRKTPKVQAFLDELNELQKRHELHLEHQDSHGAFEIWEGAATLAANDETYEARVGRALYRFRKAWVSRHSNSSHVRYAFAALCSTLGRTTAAQRRRDRLAQQARRLAQQARIEACRLAHERLEIALRRR